MRRGRRTLQNFTPVGADIIRQSEFTMRTIEFKITEKDSGRQIRDFLRDFGVSSSLLTKLKNTENGITLNNAFARTIDPIKAGDILKINIENRGQMPAPSDKRVEIIFEDEDIIAVNKPPFMPVHESRNHQGDALSNAVANYVDKNTAFRAVYRLDRDTSGIVLIAKNELVASKLAGQIKKDYYAVASRDIGEKGTIKAPIARENESIIKRCVKDSGETAVTHFEKIKAFKHGVLYKINLETGRTHQIRVHFAHLGASLVGDTLYGGNSKLINRQALHCKTICFTHPITGEEMKLNSDFPEDIKILLEKQ